MKKMMALLLALCFSVALFSCGKTENEDVTVKVVTLMGPTGMGMVQLMQNDKDGTSANDYEFTLASSPEEAQSAIASVDIAALPVNLAAALYNKGEDISFAAINTLGVLSILENGNTIQSVSDLKGKTIYATGKGSTPEYILNYLLTKNGIDPEKDVTIEYLTEHTELATKLASGDAAIGLLPEPNVTVALTSAAASGNTELRIALDVTEEWAKLGEGELVQGCIVVSNRFKTEHPEQYKAFMEEYKASVNYVNSNIDSASAAIAEFGIVPKAEIAKKAIPNCNICCLDGEEGIRYMEAMLTVLCEANAKSVGGKLPDDAFYGK